MDRTPLLSNTTEPSLNLVRLKKIKTIAKKTIPDAGLNILSYSFSMTGVVDGIIAGKLKTNNVLGALALFSTVKNAIVVITVAPFFAILILNAPKYGQIISLEAEIEKIEEKQRLISLRSTDSTADPLVSDDALYQADIDDQLPEAEEKSNITQLQTQIQTLKDEISTSAVSGLILATGISALAWLTMYFLSDKIFILFNQERSTIDVAEDYLKPYSFAIPGICLQMVFEEILFSVGKKKIATGFAFSLFILATFFADIFGLGHFGAPKLGLAGIAYTWIGLSYVTPLLDALYLKFNPFFKDFSFSRKLTKENFKEALAFLKISFPIWFGVTNELLLNFVLNMFAGMKGEKELEAQAYAGFCLSISFMSVVAFGSSTMQSVGHHFGEGVSKLKTLEGGDIESSSEAREQFQTANDFAYYGILVNVLFLTAVIGLPLGIDPSILEYLLAEAPSSETMNLAKPLVQLTTFLVIPLDIIRYTMLQVLRMTGDNFNSTAITFFSLWCIGLPITYSLMFGTELGILGLPLGYSIGLLINIIGLSLRYSKKLSTDALEETAIAQQAAKSSASPALPSERKRLISGNINEEDEMNEREPLNCRNCWARLFYHFYPKTKDTQRTEQAQELSRSKSKKGEADDTSESINSLY